MFAYSRMLSVGLLFLAGLFSSGCVGEPNKQTKIEDASETSPTHGIQDNAIRNSDERDSSDNFNELRYSYDQTYFYEQQQLGIRSGSAVGGELVRWQNRQFSKLKKLVDEIYDLQNLRQSEVEQMNKASYPLDRFNELDSQIYCRMLEMFWGVFHIGIYARQPVSQFRPDLLKHGMPSLELEDAAQIVLDETSDFYWIGDSIVFCKWAEGKRSWLRLKGPFAAALFLEQPINSEYVVEFDSSYLSQSRYCVTIHGDRVIVTDYKLGCSTVINR